MYSLILKKNVVGEKRSIRLMAFFLLSMVALLISAAIPAAWAEEDDFELPFDVAEVYFELNNTDGDLGIHSLIDGEPWKRLEIEDPRGRRVLNIFVQNRLRRQGLTELFFESAEPTFDELRPRRFFRRFPEGEYEVEGTTLDGVELESTAILTHLLPSPPENIMVNHVAVPEDCDEDPILSVDSPVVITWDPVTRSHPELGRTGEPIEVIRYQVVVEQEDLGLKFTVDLPPDVFELALPAALTDLSDGESFKLEILVREASGNQTAVETCFVVD